MVDGRRLRGFYFLRLFTFLISHFSEKARWALDLNGLKYEERRLLPVAHVPVIRWRAPKTTVPVLEHEGTVIQGSGAILDYAEERLGATKLASSNPRAREIEAMADKAFGRGVQRIFYAALLEVSNKHVLDMWSQKGPWWARVFYGLTFPLAKPRLAALYDTRPESVTAAKDAFRRGYDELDAVLEKQPYLLGDTLTRADVTVAALLAPICKPPEHPFEWPTETPEGLKPFLEELKDRPTSRFVSRMYREHRR